jgi:hypothetical protein
MFEADDDSATDPPDAFRVAQRAMVLASCACRASLEASSKDRGARRMHDDLQKWVVDIGVRDEFEDCEWNSVVAPLGSLDRRTHLNLSWRTEGLVVLAWSLGRADLPPYDEEADGPSVGDTIGFLDDSARDLLLSPRLRPAADLEWIANLTVAVHWRLRKLSLDPKAMDFCAFAHSVEWAEFPVDDLKFLDRDLALRGTPIAQASRTVIDCCSSIIRERQQAANWLRGDQELYSEVTCDT